MPTPASLAIHFAGKTIDKAVSDSALGWLKKLFFPKKKYKTELTALINQTVDDYEKLHISQTNLQENKFPFYHSQIIFDTLTQLYLFKKDSVILTADIFLQNPKIIVPTQSELDAFYGLFIQKINESETLKKLFTEEFYKDEIFNLSKSISELLGTNSKILEKLDSVENLSQLSNIQLEQLRNRFNSDVQLYDKYRIQGLELYQKLEKLTERSETVKILTDFLKDKTWVALQGNISMGKTQLAVLVSEKHQNKYWVEAKGIDKSVLLQIIISELKGHFATDEEDNSPLSTLIQKIPEHSVIVVDDLPSLTNLSKNEVGRLLELLKLFKEQKIHFLTTSNYLLPEAIRSFWSDFEEYVVTGLSDSEVGEIMASYGADTNTMQLFSGIIGNLSEGHPALVTAICRHLTQIGWKFDQTTLESLFKSEYASGMQTEIYEKLLKTVLDQDSRELLYRLKIVLNRISNVEVGIVSNAEPEIIHPFEKLNSLKGLWVQALKAGYYELSPLIKKIDNNLSLALTRSINHRLGSHILSFKKLTQLEAHRAILYFIAANELNKAGFVLSIALQAAQKDSSIFFDWGFDSFWLNEPLPVEMEIYIQAVIRYFQINLLKKKNEKIDFLVSDLENIIHSATMENINIAPAAFGLALHFSETNSTKANNYLVIALTQFDQLKIVAPEKFLKDLVLNIEMLIWNNLVGVKNRGDLEAWLNLINTLTPQQIEASIDGYLHLAASGLLCSRFFDDELSKAQPDWQELLSTFQIVIDKLSIYPNFFLLSTCFKYQIRILLAYVKDNKKASDVFHKAEVLFDGLPLHLFMINDEYGRQLFYQGENDTALPYLIAAQEIDTPEIFTDKIFTYLALNEILSIKDVKVAHEFAKKAYELQNKNLFVEDVLSARTLGEYAISLWENQEKRVVFYYIEVALQKVLFGYKPAGDYQATLIRLGHVLNYCYCIETKRSLPKVDGKEYFPPFRGMFVKPDDLLIDGGYYFEQRKFMLAFLMLQCFEFLDDVTNAKKWAYKAIELHTQEKLNPFKSLLTTSSSYLIIDGKYEEAFQLGIDVINPDQDVQTALEENPELNPILRNLLISRQHPPISSSDVLLFEYMFNFIVVKVLHDYAKNEDANIPKEFIGSIASLKTYFKNTIGIETVEKGFEFLIDNEKKYGDILQLANYNDPDLASSISMLLYLISSFKTTVLESLKLHFALIARLERLATSLSGDSAYRFIVVPFMIDFWVKKAELERNSFFNYDYMVSNGFEKVHAADTLKKLKILFTVLSYHLEYELGEKEESWLTL